MLALASTYMLDSRLPQTPTPLLFAAVTLSAQYGGLGPGLLSTLLSALGLEVFLEDQVGIRGAGGSSILHLCVFVLVAILVSTLNDRTRRAETQAHADATRLRVLSDASRAFAAVVPDHLTTLQTVARQLVDALGDSCVINLLSEDGRWLNQAAWHHRDPDAHMLMTRLYTGQGHAADEGLSGQALRQGRPVMIATNNPDEVRAAVKPGYAPLLDRFPIYSILSIPLKARHRMIGTLAVWRCAPGEPFTPSDQELLQELADRAALAIDNARLSAYYRALFEQIPEPTVVLGTDLRLLDANPAAARLLGCSREDLRGRQVEEIVVWDAGSLESKFADLRHGGNWHGELDVRRMSGATVTVEGCIAPVQHLTGPVYIWVWHDLTEQQALQKMRNNFVASASHELRTPLTAALAALGLMQQSESGDLQPAHRELADNAMRNIQRLRILVDDLLLEGQLQADALGLNPRPLDLRGVIAGAVEAMHSLLQRKEQSIELDLPEPLPVNGDAHRLEQVFVNLLANANQHTPKGTLISIRGVVSEREVSVSVCDDGPGFPAGQIETIFERFAHPGAASSGTGLGLAIAHDLIELHSGRIWAENRPGHGAVFHIALPCSPDGG
jgi:PAS domain S-box-containing protein